MMSMPFNIMLYVRMGSEPEKGGLKKIEQGFMNIAF